MVSERKGSRLSHLIIIPNTKRHPKTIRKRTNYLLRGNYRPSKAVPLIILQATDEPHLHKYGKLEEIPAPLTRTRVEGVAPQNPLPPL